MSPGRSSRNDNDGKPEYQHFIPRFILRHFADDGIPIERGRSNRRDGKLRSIDLRDGLVRDIPLSKHLGLEDMYKDPNHEQKQGIERQLSVLESKAGQIIANARRTFQNPDATFNLTRSQVTDMRKFLFLMKYRNMTFYARYNCSTMEEYSANDKQHMAKWISDRGYSSPRDVWYANLRAFLDVCMDKDRAWHKTLRSKAYPDDAKLFIAHAETKFITFCRPQLMTDEFLLTENVFGIFEGPALTSRDINTGRESLTRYTEWHNFAPLSPTLMIILRTTCIPGPGPNADFRKMFYEFLRNQYPRPEDARSVLEDLPVTRCQTSYPTIVHLERGMASTEKLLSYQDTFTFKCFSLLPGHVQTINNLILEEAWEGSTIVFKGLDAAFRTIKTYLESKSPDWKITLSNDTQRPEYFRRLKSCLQHLRPMAEIQASYRVLRPPLIHEDVILHILIALTTELSITGSELNQLYLQTGGSIEVHAMIQDIDQALRIAILEVITDEEMQRNNLDEAIQTSFRRLRTDLFASLPAPRIWLYVKVLRNLRNFNRIGEGEDLPELVFHGLEDEVVGRISRYRLAQDILASARER